MVLDRNIGEHASAGATVHQHAVEALAGCGDQHPASRACEAALRSDPELSVSRRAFVLRLIQTGRGEEALSLFRTELALPDGERWFSDMIMRALELPSLSLAGNLAQILVHLQRGGPWFADAHDPPTFSRFITLPSLRHDLAQLRYLKDLGILGRSADEAINRYTDAIVRYEDLGNNRRVPLSAIDEREIGTRWARIIYLDPGPRVPVALSSHWSRDEAQRLYRERSPGVVVIDNFLTEEALAGIERFCLRSTVWSGNQYADGRLGAFFFSGFNCPLLLQIAEEIRDALPAVIGPRYPLRQLWGFKNTGMLPADSTVHADFAAVNVNFWITADGANLDPTSGGMRVYDLAAPRSWDFTAYNEQSGLIRDYIAAYRPREIRVPYRRNRVILFDSDLFHVSEAIRFRSDYASHRINITMLYGDRYLDEHHPVSDCRMLHSNWRSRAFSSN
jgi:hypothetical protein